MLQLSSLAHPSLLQDFTFKRLWKRWRTPNSAPSGYDPAIAKRVMAQLRSKRGPHVLAGLRRLAARHVDSNNHHHEYLDAGGGP